MGYPGESLTTEERASLADRYRRLDGQMLKSMTEGGLTWLRTNQQIVNSLNVFPVPDGDTGTNMTLTMQAACDEVGEAGDTNAGRVAKAIAHGALMGARGNSGVILSQLWRGFARSLDELPSIDTAALAQAFAMARDTAYKGVVHPVEGTILTVSKDVAEAAQELVGNPSTTPLEMLDQIVRAADASVQRTPDLLPVLREAGVVDSGGKGLYFLLEGMLRSVYGDPLDTPLATVQPLSALELAAAGESIEPGQDWEVIVDFRPGPPLDVEAFYRRLENMGTSIQVGEGEGIYRMHIHVPDQTQYVPVEYIQTLGTITKVSFENLMEQIGGAASGPASLKLTVPEPGQIAAVSVVPGPGIARVFASLGAASIVEGGQTMNPSTQELLNAAETLPTDQVVLLPNNKNIVLTARQAAELSARHIRVVPSTSVPQGIAAMLALDPDGDLDSTAAAMQAAMQDIRSIELTIATRSVEIDGVNVETGQVIGLLDGRLVMAGNDLETTLQAVLEAADAGSAELITLYFGADLTTMKANQIGDRLRQIWSRQDIEVVEGRQPHYQLIVSLE
jgi:hypothetical protein